MTYEEEYILGILSACKILQANAEGLAMHVISLRISNKSVAVPRQDSMSPYHAGTATYIVCALRFYVITLTLALSPVPTIATLFPSSAALFAQAIPPALAPMTKKSNLATPLGPAAAG